MRLIILLAVDAAVPRMCIAAVLREVNKAVQQPLGLDATRGRVFELCWSSDTIHSPYREGNAMEINGNGLISLGKLPDILANEV